MNLLEHLLRWSIDGAVIGGLIDVGIAFTVIAVAACTGFAHWMDHLAVECRCSRHFISPTCPRHGWQREDREPFPGAKPW